MDNSNNPNPANPNPIASNDPNLDPINPQPQSLNPWASNSPIQNDSTFNTKIPAPPDPIQQTSSDPTSPLDNPWNAQPQSQVADLNSNPASSPQPTWIPPNPNSQNPQEAISNTPIENLSTEQAFVYPQSGTQQTPQTQQPPVNQQPSGSVPTDLSHLINNNPQDPAQNSSAETLVMPPQPSTLNPDVPTAPAKSSTSIPKWLIGTGVGLLIVVISASAYFILGVGQNTKTTSVPAEVTKSQSAQNSTPTQTAPAIQPESTLNQASESSSFGQLDGGSATQQATSAADILKQKQQSQ